MLYNLSNTSNEKQIPKVPVVWTKNNGEILGLEHHETVVGDDAITAFIYMRSGEGLPPIDVQHKKVLEYLLREQENGISNEIVHVVEEVVDDGKSGNAILMDAMNRAKELQEKISEPVYFVCLTGGCLHYGKTAEQLAELSNNPVITQIQMFQCDFDQENENVANRFLYTLKRMLYVAKNTEYVPKNLLECIKTTKEILLELNRINNQEMENFSIDKQEGNINKTSARENY